MKTRESTVNSRVLLLITKLNLGANQFCLLTGISTGTLHNIKKGGEIQKRTIENICNGLNANQKWLLTGEGDMLKETETEAKVISIEVEQLRQENSRLQKEIDRLWQLIGHDRKVNFLNALDVADAKVIPLRDKVAYSGAKVANS